MRHRPIARRVLEEAESYSAREQRQGRAGAPSRLQDQRDAVRALTKAQQAPQAQPQAKAQVIESRVPEEHKVIHIVKPLPPPPVKKPAPAPPKRAGASKHAKAPAAAPAAARPLIAEAKAPVIKRLALEPVDRTRYGWELRSLDGSGNNLKHPQWGRAETPMVRYAEARAWRMDQARELSNAVCAADRVLAAPAAPAERLSLLWVAWSQLVDQELSLVLQTERAAHLECVADAAGRESYAGRRVEYHCSSARDGAPINSTSAYLDASLVYGLSSERAAALRAWTRGQLRLEAGQLPRNRDGLENLVPAHSAGVGSGAADYCLAGNPRVNESALLLALQTVLAREHNWWCDKLLESNPELADYDEMLYQQARAIVIGVVQAITYNEWLPLLGVELPPQRYDEACHAGVAVEFAACKWWLPMVPPQLALGRDRLPLAQTAFRPELAKRCDELMASAAEQPAQPLQEQVVDALRNASDGARVGDAAAEVLQRARDHQCADYAALRGALGLAPRSVHELADAAVQAHLARLPHLDAWLGAVCEPDHELIKALLAKQLQAVRDGDRFWYASNPALSDELRSIIDRTRLAHVLRRNCKGRFPDHAFCAPPALTAKARR